jgi:hypothetical protein
MEPDLELMALVQSFIRKTSRGTARSASISCSEQGGLASHLAKPLFLTSQRPSQAFSLFGEWLLRSVFHLKPIPAILNI